MQLTGGYPFWLINNGLVHAYPKLLENRQTNTVIIGGGISGALITYYLINAGIECILIDARTIGLGSTCASTSLLQYEIDEPLHLLKEKIGTEKAIRAYRLCGNAIDDLVQVMNDIGFTDYKRAGSLFFSGHRSEKNFMQLEFEARKAAGFEVSLLNAAELKNLYGLKAEYAILSKQGCTTNAYSLTHALLQHLLKKGLQVYDRTQITDIDYATVTLHTADGFTVRAKNIINATGYEIVNFIPKDIVDFYCTYAMVSEHGHANTFFWKDDVMMWNTDNPYLYMRVTEDKRILLGGRDERFSNTFTRQVLLEKKSKQLERDLKRFLPGISFKKEFVWSGTFGKTKDSLPYIGQYTKTPNTYYALGFGGNGITFSVIAAEILRDILCGKQNTNAPLFAFDR